MGSIKIEDLRIPNHLAIILDGNGRWAAQRGLVRTLGHKAGAESLRETVKACFDLGIKVLSVYAFSTENWKRPKDEVDFLFTLPAEYFKKHLNYFLNKDVKMIISGDMSRLPEETRKVCEDTILKTSHCKTYVFNVCLNYGSHDELIKACKEIASEVKDNKLNVEDIDGKVIESHLYTKGLPPVDLLIRTSNEKRISNFMLWQISYAELYFTKTYWPAFTKKALMDALKDYTNRNRRFGGISK